METTAIALRHALAPGRLCWSTVAGRALVILLLRRQGELRQGHTQLMYNPVWSAKRKKGLIPDDIDLAMEGRCPRESRPGPLVGAWSSFRWPHLWTAVHCSSSKNPTPEQGPLGKSYLEPFSLDSSHAGFISQPHHTPSRCGCFAQPVPYGWEALSSSLG